MLNKKNIYVCRGKNWAAGGSVGWFTIDDIVAVKAPKNCSDATGEWSFRVTLSCGDSFTCRSVDCDTSYYDGAYHSGGARNNGEAEIRKVYAQFLADIGVDIVQE